MYVFPIYEIRRAHCHVTPAATEAEDRAIQELAEELHATQDAKSQQERAFQEERSALQAEIHRLKSASGESGASLTVEQERSGRLERELHQVRAQMESEGVARADTGRA